MAEIPDIHEYPLLVEHFNLIQKIQFEEKDKEEIKRLCYRMIEIIPECKKQAQIFSERKQRAMKEWHVRLGENYPPEYYDKYKFTLSTFSPFKTLAILFEKEGNIPQAIAICHEALSAGYEDDGTKGGMEGRLKKLMKKVN